MSGEQRPAGLGAGLERDGELLVGALAAVNAFGDIRGSGEPPAATTETPFGESTTLVVVATNARLSKGECFLVAQSCHDGLARALEPVHTQFDGDASVAAATGALEGVHVETVRLLAARAVEEAVRRAATP
jgi:L-aminopeptidase/D-esterase-like protein